MEIIKNCAENKVFFRQENPQTGTPVPPNTYDTCRDLVRMLPANKLDIVKIVKRVWMLETNGAGGSLLETKHFVEAMMGY